MRLFIAVEVPEAVKHHLTSIQESLNHQQEGIKWVKKDAMHLTIKFLGEVSEEKYQSVVEALERVTFPSFNAHLSNVGAFPHTNFIRVLWVGVEPSDKIRELQQQVEGLLLPLGFKKDHKFHPHLTIGRVKFLKQKKEFIEGMTQTKVDRLEFPVNKIKLIKSTLTKQGPVYEVLQEFG